MQAMELLFSNTGIIAWGGVAIIILLIYAETGLLLGLVVPGGETLVFTAGLLASTNTLDISIFLLLILLIASGTAGDISGFYIGKKFGKKLYHKKDTWYFKQKYLQVAEDFLSKHSKLAIILGKFFPIVRPFTPVISGTTRFKFGSFISLSLVAVLLYMCIFCLGGYFLGKRFPQIENYLVWLLPVSIIVSLVPVVRQVRKYKAGQRI